MKVPLVALFITTLSMPSAFAQRQCTQKSKSVACYDYLKSLLIDRDEKAPLEDFIKTEGIEPFFRFDYGTQYTLIADAVFFDNYHLFNTMLASDDYPENLPDKKKFLASVFSSQVDEERNTKLATMIFLNPDPKKRMEWWENANWPYPKFESLKRVTQKTSELKVLLEYFDSIQAVKGNLCSIKSIEDFNRTKTKFPNFEKILNYSTSTLFKCAIDNGDLEFAHYLFGKVTFSLKETTDLINKLDSFPESTRKAEFLAVLESRVENELHQFKAECSPLGVQPENEQFIDINSKVVQHMMTNKIKMMKEVSGDKVKLKSVINDLIEIYQKTKLNPNLKDSEGKTLFHHLAPYLDENTVKQFERFLNNGRRNINYQAIDNDGNTPLHLALLSNNFAGAKALSDDSVWAKNGFAVRFVSELRTKNNKGQTPLDLAKKLEVPKAQKKQKKLMISEIKQELELLEKRNKKN